MKLLTCEQCVETFVLDYKPRDCACGNAGGFYNKDGDTATVWGTFHLFGLNNHAMRTVFFGYPLTDWRGDKVLWDYPVDNGKITVADELVEKAAA